MDDKSKENPDEIMVAMTTALSCLSVLLRYATEPNHMSDYDAACKASEGIQALAKALPEINL